MVVSLSSSKIKSLFKLAFSDVIGVMWWLDPIVELRKSRLCPFPLLILREPTIILRLRCLRRYLPNSYWWGTCLVCLMSSCLFSTSCKFVTSKVSWSISFFTWDSAAVSFVWFSGLLSVALLRRANLYGFADFASLIKAFERPYTLSSSLFSSSC